jgi:hypothetical protein
MPKKVYEIDTNGQYDIIYATSGILPYDFDRGYTNSDVIMSKKFCDRYQFHKHFTCNLKS